MNANPYDPTADKPVCPCCGAQIVTWYSRSQQAVQAVCGDTSTSCPAATLIGEGDSTGQAIDHFLGLCRVEGKVGK